MSSVRHSRVVLRARTPLSRKEIENEHLFISSKLWFRVFYQIKKCNGTILKKSLYMLVSVFQIYSCLQTYRNCLLFGNTSSLSRFCWVGTVFLIFSLNVLWFLFYSSCVLLCFIRLVSCFVLFVLCLALFYSSCVLLCFICFESYSQYCRCLLIPPSIFSNVYLALG